MNWAPPDFLVDAANDAISNNIMANHYSYVPALRSTRPAPKTKVGFEIADGRADLFVLPRRPSTNSSNPAPPEEGRD